jgi:hypothetical protein
MNPVSGSREKRKSEEATATPIFGRNYVKLSDLGRRAIYLPLLGLLFAVLALMVRLPNV